MTVEKQPRAEASGLIYAFDHSRGEMSLIPDPGAATGAAAKPKLAGSIALGLVIGAAAGILVGGLLGVHESSSGSIGVAGVSVAQSTAP